MELVFILCVFIKVTDFFFLFKNKSESGSISSKSSKLKTKVNKIRNDCNNEATRREKKGLFEKIKNSSLFLVDCFFLLCLTQI